tara:strand:+ start:218 stop:427 length:210 start_codon:yes stop_codon:yes gene_type:complete
MNTVTVDFKLDLKLATREYFLNGNSIIYGTIFYIKSARTGQFEGPYALDTDHVSNMKEWLENEMVWVKA